jgi:hypothetical protein
LNKKKTIVAGEVAWSLKVAAELLRTTKSGVHESLTLGQIQGGGEYSLRWSFIEFVSNIVYELGYV